MKTVTSRLSFPRLLVPVSATRARIDLEVLYSSHVSTESSLRKKNTIHQVTTMLATSKNVKFPGHNHLLTTGTDDPSLTGTRVIIKVSGISVGG